MRSTLAAIAVLLSSFVAHAQSFNLVANGDFENGTLGGWDVSGGILLATEEQYLDSGGFGSFPSGGEYVVGFSAGGLANDGVLSQSVATEPGRQYRLRFDYGCFSDLGFSSSLDADVRDVATGTRLNGVGISDVGTPILTDLFDTYSFTFIAIGTQTVVTFADTSFPQASTDGVLDNVSVTLMAARCPYDADGDGRVDIDDLYHLTQNPADINGDGVADAGDTACLEAYLRCVELLDMSLRPGEPAADGNVPSLEYVQSDTGGGLVQTLSVVRTPSPDGTECVSQSWTTTLLGTRQGLAGPVEIRLDRDGFLWQRLFADAASASPGSSVASGMLTCDGSAIELVAVTPGGTVGSADGLRALVLLDGQNITQMAITKGVIDAPSKSIGGSLVNGFVESNGHISLPSRGLLICLELNAVSPCDPEFRYDDVVLFVDVNCGNLATQTSNSPLVILDTSSLPSSQPGWMYAAFDSDAGVPESEVFSTSGSVLTSNTMHLAFAPNRSAGNRADYLLDPLSVSTDSIVVVRMRARVLESEVAQFPYGFAIGLFVHDKGWNNGFTTSYIDLDLQQQFLVDNTEWTEYLWVGNWGEDSYRLYINGVLVVERPLFFTDSNANRVFVGDTTGTANARAEIAEFSVGVVLPCVP